MGTRCPRGPVARVAPRKAVCVCAFASFCARVLVAKLFLFQTDLAVPVDVKVEFHRMAVAQAGSKWRSLKPGWIFPKAWELVEGSMRSREETRRKETHMARNSQV